MNLNWTLEGENRFEKEREKERENQVGRMT